ncbi:Fibroblast growth factor 15 [Cricetulus griseus]|uniref:Fibroblast growth factor 15 n=1 Tax=Cricetulus griseus TaxID=10029 RepID=G3I4D9_CRIGR|nr:Fibroblast growth factor 15 [Cricetulus griseus]
MKAKASVPGNSTRLQYLYVAGPHISNCFVHIRSDGSVDCEDEQNERSLLEFRAVAVKTIVIKDVSSVRYLCMSADGKIQGLLLTLVPIHQALCGSVCSPAACINLHPSFANEQQD